MRNGLHCMSVFSKMGTPVSIASVWQFSCESPFGHHIQLFFLNKNINLFLQCYFWELFYMENTYAAQIETTCTEWGSSESAWAPAHYGFEISPSNGYKRILLLMVIQYSTV